MKRLWHKPEQKYLVDFLDEAVRRYSSTTPAEFADVRMKGVTRQRKVRIEALARFIIFLHSNLS
jgi:hypothetical protein